MRKATLAISMMLAVGAVSSCGRDQPDGDKSEPEPTVSTTQLDALPEDKSLDKPSSPEWRTDPDNGFDPLYVRNVEFADPEFREYIKELKRQPQNEGLPVAPPLHTYLQELWRLRVIGNGFEYHAKRVEFNDELEDAGSKLRILEVSMQGLATLQSVDGWQTSIQLKHPLDGMGSRWPGPEDVYPPAVIPPAIPLSD
jgi:hypothetical protein